MAILKVAPDIHINTHRITYIDAKKRDKVIIQFQNEINTGGFGVPPSYIELKGPEAQAFLQWLEANTDQETKFVIGT